MIFYPFDFGSPEYHQSYELRNDILRIPLNLEFTPSQLASEYELYHLGAFSEEGRLLGTLIMSPLNKETIKMRQVAVAEELQGKGIGAKLVAYSEVFSRALGYKVIELNARDVSIPFYKKINYKIVGEGFKEVNIPHHKMVKNI